VNVHILPCGDLETNAYLVAEPARGEAVLVDAPPGSHAVVTEILAAEGWKLVALLLTHGHWDHTMDAARFQRDGVPVHGHPDDRMLFETPGVMEAFLPGRIRLEPVKLQHEAVQGTRMDLLGTAWEVRHVPGHCPGNVLFHVPSERVAFVGDAIFAGSVGRTDLPGGNADVLAKSIRTQIYTLPPETVLFPGHGPETTVDDERFSNPFVRHE
jgi:glyoxylase-like metal-dependent hydrolase (beta-lactamase superfamily II)